MALCSGLSISVVLTLWPSTVFSYDGLRGMGTLVRKGAEENVPARCKLATCPDESVFLSGSAGFISTRFCN